MSAFEGSTDKTFNAWCEMNNKNRVRERIAKLEQQKLELISELDRIEKSEKIDLNICLDDYRS